MRVIDLRRKRAYQSVGVTFDPLYQAVLDEAITQGITTPSLSQNVSNDAIARKLRSKGLLDNDLFYYFQQDDAALYEFCTLNWMNPTLHRLTNEGTNPVEFVPGLGFKVTGSNSQFFNTNFTPTTDAVHAVNNDNGVVVRFFDVPPTWTANLRIAGGWGASGSGFGVNIAKTNSSTCLFRVYTGSNAQPSLSMDEVSSNQINWSYSEAVGGSGQLYKDETSGTQARITNTQKTDTKLHLFGLNVNGLDYPSEGGFGMRYFMFGASKLGVKNTNLINILNSGKSFQPADPGVLKIDLNSTSLISIYWPQIRLASDFPTLNTVKDYLVFYSTDHSNGPGGIAWGEADDVALNGFIERGIIIQEYQSETGYPVWVANDPDGLNIHLYYHTNSTDPDNGGDQITHRLRRAGGDLHDAAGWTKEKGVFGVTATESSYTNTHLGYAGVFVENDFSLTAIHHTHGYNTPTLSGINNFGKTVSTDNGVTWSRVTSDIDNTSFMPLGRLFHISPPFYFKRNGVQYALGLNVDYNYDVEGRAICMVKCGANDYLPTELIGNISGELAGDSCKICGYYINPLLPDILNLYYTTNNGGAFGSDPGTELYHTTWDLKNLD